jgi:hypothetical protein
MRKSSDIIKRLAARVYEIAVSEGQIELRKAWARHNNLEKVGRPLGICRPVNWGELIPEDEYAYHDGIEHQVESNLRQLIYHHDIIGDDYVIDPWYEITAIPTDSRNTMWGVPVDVKYTDVAGGSFRFDPQIKTEDDINRLKAPSFDINKQATEELIEKVEDLLGDTLPIHIDYSAPLHFGICFSYWGAYLRGLDQLMLDIYDRPEWLHRFFGFMNEAYYQNFKGKEANGYIRLNNYGMLGHCEGLPQLDYSGKNARLKDCWCSADSQEFTMVSPDQFEEFLLQYQAPLTEMFGLTAYGCCENLTHKYDLLKQYIKNLRRVTCSPWTDPKVAADKLENKYVIQWRPNPSYIIFSFTEEQMKEYAHRHLEIFKECHVDISLQDLETVNGEPWRLQAWSKIIKTFELH